MFKLRVPLHKINVQVKTYSKPIMKLALADTKYEIMLPLFKSKYLLLFGPENCIGKIIKISKRTPQLILMAGIIDNRLLSKNEVLKYSTSEGIDAARAELVATLNFATSNLHSTLQNHQQNLVTLLDAYARGETTKPTDDNQNQNGEENNE